jgi:hypothetical protein
MHSWGLLYAVWLDLPHAAPNPLGMKSARGLGRRRGALVGLPTVWPDPLRICPDVCENGSESFSSAIGQEIVFKCQKYQWNFRGSTIEEPQGEEVRDKTAHSAPVQLFPAHCSHSVLLFISLSENHSFFGERGHDTHAYSQGHVIARTAI